MLGRQNFHLAAFRGSVVNATTNTAIAGVATDQVLTRAASGAYLVPEGAQIRAAWAGGINATRSRFDTPEMRKVGNVIIAPLNQTVAIPSPANVADYGRTGIRPIKNDELSVQATHSDAAPQIQYAIAVLQFGRDEPQNGPEFRVRWTAAVAGVVGAWAVGALTLDVALPSGRYQINGMDVFGTNLIAARLAFPGGSWRPGVIGRNAVNSVPPLMFQDGSLGIFGEFDNTAPPQLEVFVEAANAAQEGFFDLVKV